MSTNITNQVASGRDPILKTMREHRVRETIARLQADQERRKNDVACISKQPPEDDARQMVRALLAALSPVQQPAPKASEDLVILRKTIVAISEAAESKAITDEEADAVALAVIDRFVNRRFDHLMHKVFVPNDEAWFMFASRRTYGPNTTQWF